MVVVVVLLLLLLVVVVVVAELAVLVAPRQGCCRPRLSALQ